MVPQGFQNLLLYLLSELYMTAETVQSWQFSNHVHTIQIELIEL